MASFKFISDVAGEVASFSDIGKVIAYLAGEESLKVDGTLYAVYDDEISDNVIVFDMDTDAPQMTGDPVFEGVEFPDKDFRLMAISMANNSVFRYVPRKQYGGSLAS
jgi:hypothetical protein